MYFTYQFSFFKIKYNQHIILLFQGIRVLVLNVIMGAIALQMMKFSLDVTVHRTTKATIVMKVRM